MSIPVVNILKTWISSSYLISYQHQVKQYKFKLFVYNRLDVRSGVPQGSILGLVLTILYISDIKECMQLNDILLFKMTFDDIF